MVRVKSSSYIAGSLVPGSLFRENKAINTDTDSLSACVVKLLRIYAVLLLYVQDREYRNSRAACDSWAGDTDTQYQIYNKRKIVQWAQLIANCATIVSVVWQKTSIMWVSTVRSLKSVFMLLQQLPTPTQHTVESFSCNKTSWPCSCM